MRRMLLDQLEVIQEALTHVPVWEFVFAQCCRLTCNAALDSDCCVFAGIKRESHQLSIRYTPAELFLNSSEVTHKLVGLELPPIVSLARRHGDSVLGRFGAPIA